MTSGLTRWTRAVTALGSVSSLTVISLFLGIVFALRKAVYPLLLLALTMLGGSVLNMLLKHLFQRQRPAFENPLVTLNSYGFPSGHTMGTTLLCGALALIAAATLKSRIARASVFCLAAIWVMIIGASRIYLGAHYFTDVIGAIAAGLAWLAFCWTAVETLRRWRMRQGRHVAPVAT
ncbi:MAG: phosphatase PAP2 family protein [Chthoniobacterales bacterium]|nr:phosphatase PAP2 family protein [Chthoniobacterales bacterium]